jgi:hypothetical protein
MNWKQDLNELIETTMAIARDARYSPFSGTPNPESVLEKPDLALMKQPIELRADSSSVVAPFSERELIKQRVANFKSHQQRMAREREAYYLQMKAAILTSLAKHD